VWHEKNKQLLYGNVKQQYIELNYKSVFSFFGLMAVTDDLQVQSIWDCL
jgi:hypothetical protein